ncbi:NAD(P)-dependent oxidoreductase [Brucella cytisi]|uniref:NAD(P)-dependent oxidoreductase n=1 Tax=Brucella cytisi TaxID=407152 RepID=UPI001F3B41A6|nr:NAD(P)-dependent oxidoreductase [Brucella cytisi]
MINAEQLARMKTGAILINTARGGLIVEEALADAIASGHLAGAGIDTFVEEPLASDHPFRAFDSIVMTPHMAEAPIRRSIASHSAPLKMSLMF